MLRNHNILLSAFKTDGNWSYRGERTAAKNFSDYAKLARKLFKPKSSHAATVLVLKAGRFSQISNFKRNFTRNSGNPLIRYRKTLVEGRESVSKDKTMKTVQENPTSEFVKSRHSRKLYNDDRISNIQKPDPD